MFYLRHNFNYRLNQYFKKRWTGVKYTKLDADKLLLFKNSGEGLYNIFFERNVYSSSPFFYSIVTKIIYWVSGKYTHVATVLYSENIKNFFNQIEWNKLIKKYMFFYGVGFYEAEFLLKDTKVLVLASADETGMNYFNYSYFQKRPQTITRPILNSSINSINDVKFIVSLYLSDKIYNSFYDFFALIFWGINRTIFDYFSFYCSELVYYVFNKVGIKLADNKHPSPTEELIQAIKEKMSIKKFE